MADEEIATRAPESDAQEDVKPPTVVEDDSKPDQGAASMGEHCTTDRPTRTVHDPENIPDGQLTDEEQRPASNQLAYVFTSEIPEISKLNDIDCYITKPADYPHSPSKLLLLLSGGTGIKSTNNQIQADKYAAEGFLVVMPDQFEGDAVSPSSTVTATAEEGSSIIEQIKLGIASAAKSFTIDMWLARHTPEKVLPILHKVIDAAKEEFADAVSHGGGIYAAGYCFGAKYVLLLGSELHDDVAAGQRPTESTAEEGMVRRPTQIKAGAFAHGTQVTVSDLENCTVPVCVVAVEDDVLFPDDVRDEGIKAMQKKGTEHELTIYPGVPHGFAVLGDYADQSIVVKQKEAFQQMLQWLKSH